MDFAKRVLSTRIFFDVHCRLQMSDAPIFNLSAIEGRFGMMFIADCRFGKLQCCNPQSAFCRFDAVAHVT